MNPGRRTEAHKAYPVMRETAAYKGCTHQGCEYFPCHPGVRRPFNCLFCYCPLIERECPGPYRLYTNPHGKPGKDCSSCRLPHDGIGPSWRFIQRWLTAPPWSGGPQSPARIRANARALRAQAGARVTDTTRHSTQSIPNATTAKA